MNVFADRPVSEFMKKDFKIQFSGEGGNDMGGPRREFFMELSRYIFNPDCGYSFLLTYVK